MIDSGRGGRGVVGGGSLLLSVLRNDLEVGGVQDRSKGNRPRVMLGTLEPPRGLFNGQLMRL